MSTSTNQIPRQSNIELLRILAMFLVLVRHAGSWSLGDPSVDDFVSNPVNAWTRTFFDSVSIVCVNVFVLISGWFGIRFSAKGLCNFVFQCAYFLFGIYIVLLSFGLVELSVKGIARCLSITHINWFIKAYVALYILAPVLNAYVEKASRRQFATFLILFFVFQTIWGWSGAASWVRNGYSAFSFTGLYLLARYTHLYGIPHITTRGMFFYLLSVVGITITYWVTVNFGIPIDIYAYVNPLVIVGALGLLLWFANLKMKTSRFINWVAASSFAVFLLHANPNIGEPYYKPLMQYLYATYSSIPCLCIMGGTLVAIFVVAILLDQPRKWLWNIIQRKLI